MLDKFLSGNFKLLKSAIEDGENVSVFGLNLGEKLALLEDSAFLFFVVEDSDKIIEVCEKFEALGRTCEYLNETISPLSSEFQGFEKIINVLHKIIDGDINTLVITSEVMTGLFPKKEKLKSLKHLISIIGLSLFNK